MQTKINKMVSIKSDYEIVKKWGEMMVTVPKTNCGSCKLLDCHAQDIEKNLRVCQILMIWLDVFLSIWQPSEILENTNGFFNLSPST